MLQMWFVYEGDRAAHSGGFRVAGINEEYLLSFRCHDNDDESRRGTAGMGGWIKRRIRQN